MDSISYQNIQSFITNISYGEIARFYFIIDYLMDYPHFSDLLVVQTWHVQSNGTFCVRIF